jgi:hypothetical protein
MLWNAPTYSEIKMDAEIGSYQEDGDTRECPFASTEASELSAHPAQPAA